MDIVEKARQEQIETSGALHDGQTAQFLRGQKMLMKATASSMRWWMAMMTEVVRARDRRARDAAAQTGKGRGG